MKKKILVVTGGGDCPGLNAVIRGLVKAANRHGGYEVLGSIEAFTGVMRDPMEIVQLDNQAVAGIHVRGGTIIGTTNKGGPFNWPVQQADGSWELEDKSDFLIERMNQLGIDAVVSIGGDGSQKISQKLFEKGVKIVGVPKTIDNDLSATDFTFGFQTAVQIATEGVDKLVTTAESHSRVMVMEVMGRDAGFIAVNVAIGGGAVGMIVPEHNWSMEKLIKRLQKGAANQKASNVVIVAEGCNLGGAY
ncbi:MAG: 6-phosphofructokinase, partial [Bacteroidota bacterium]